MKIVGPVIECPMLWHGWLYPYGLSPMLGATCRYIPTSTAYAEEAIRTYGAFRGGWLTLKRLGRCHPWGGSGYDPVPVPEEDRNDTG